jgi:rhodanese-related sulfurtransferase
MKKTQILVLSVLFAILSCETRKGEKTEGQTEAAKSTVQKLSPREFQEKSSHAIILDVRTPEEVAAGKIAGAISIDFYRSDFLDKAKEIPKDKEIFVYCAVGARSAEAAGLLVKEGFTSVYHLEGGIRAWTSQGLPVIRE